MTDQSVSREVWNNLLKRIARRTDNRADAEDLLHAAYLRLERYRTQHTVKNPASFLVHTAFNIGVDNYRHDRVLKGGSMEDAYAVKDNAPLQDEVVAARDRLRRVTAGIDRLTPRTREVFLMHRLDGMKYQEIAACLGISQSAVEKHIAKAVLFLSDWMDGW